MSKSIYAVAVCILAGVGVILFISPKKPAPAAGDSATQTAAPAAAQSQPNPSPQATTSSHVAIVAGGAAPGNGGNAAQTNVAVRAGESVRDTNFDDRVPPEIAVQNVRRIVHQYGQMFGGNPVGTNPEITAALQGKNPKHINFLTDAAGMRVNDNGELIDDWGTPYFFHQISGSETEIHSAGPDRIMWTGDDIVAR